jgi:hypothetical protein
MSECNVQCGKTPYHTYQNSIGKLSIYNANTDPLGQGKGIVLPNGLSATPFKIPKMSVIVGWYQCDYNASEVLNPSSNLSFKPLDSVFPLPIGQQYIGNGNDLNILENEIITDRSAHPDDYTTLPRIMSRMNQLGFLTCDFSKMIGQSSNFMDGDPERNLAMTNTDVFASYIIAPVYIDFSWIYGVNV